VELGAAQIGLGTVAWALWFLGLGAVCGAFLLGLGLGCVAGRVKPREVVAGAVGLVQRAVGRDPVAKARKQTEAAWRELAEAGGVYDKGDERIPDEESVR
jgi:hypothetical protein